MKRTQPANAFTLKSFDPRFSEEFPLNKKKIIVGSAERCDLVLDETGISSVHAFIHVLDDVIIIKDLCSENGVFVNGQKIESTTVSIGDVLSFGTLSFHVQESLSSEIVENLDANILVNIDTSKIEIPPQEGLVFIDGEYCDIVFDEKDISSATNLEFKNFGADYVELDNIDDPLDISKEAATKKLEVLSYLNGNLLEVSYIDLRDGVYSLSPTKKTKFEIPFHSLQKSKLFECKKGKLTFYPQKSLTCSMAWDVINLKDQVFFSHGVEQISLRVVNTSFKFTSLPWLYRDRSFYKQSSKIFATVFLPLLALLFVTIPSKEMNNEQVAVIYKLPEKFEKPIENEMNSDFASKEPTSKTENSGHSEDKIQNKKVVDSAASAQKEVTAQAPAKNESAPVQNTKPVKAYEFKSSVAFNSLVGDAPTLGNQNSKARSTIDGENFKAGTSQNGNLVAGAKIGVSKFNGSDKQGSGSASYGSRGLATKSGFDSSYMRSKTVVLGSIDPELLRKILSEYIPQFRHCYQQELIGNSDKIKGIIDLNFTISALGKVSKFKVNAKDARFSKKGLGCMGQVLAIIDFPKPKGGGVVDVRQPLNFFAESEKL